MAIHNFTSIFFPSPDVTDPQSIPKYPGQTTKGKSLSICSKHNNVRTPQCETVRARKSPPTSLLKLRTNHVRRIRRDDINTLASTSPSPSASPVPEPALHDGHERLAKLLNLGDIFSTAITPNAANEAKREDKEETEEQEFEFRLFSTSTRQDDKENKATTADESTKEGTIANDANGSTKKLRIRVRSPTPGPVDPSEGRLVRPFRGWEYYFSTPELLSSGTSTDTRCNAEKRRQFEDVAVSGVEMMQWAKQAWVSIFYMVCESMSRLIC